MYKYLLIISLFFSSCNSIPKLVRGAHKSREENEKTITRWLQRRQIPYMVVSVSPETYYDFVPDFLGTPLLFTGNGRFISAGFENGKNCTVAIDKYVGHLKPADQMIRLPDSFFVSTSYHLPPDTPKPLKHLSKQEFHDLIKKAIKNIDTIHLNYDSLSPAFRTLSGNKFEMNRGESYDYILLLPFAKFMGSRSKENKLKDYYKAVQSNKECRIKVIIVNLDKQEWWGKEWNKKIRINI